MTHFLDRASRSLSILGVAFALTALVAAAQSAAIHDAVRQTRNVHVVGSIADPAPAQSPADARPELHFDQHPDRPYLYVADGDGIQVVDLSSPESPNVVHRISLPSAAGNEARVTGIATAVLDDRHILLAGVRHDSTSSGAALVAYDVSHIRRGSVRQAASFSLPGGAGFMSIFAYRHSTGKAILFGTEGGDIMALDIVNLLADSSPVIATYGTPPHLDDRYAGFRDFFVAFEPGAQQDRLYGAGAGGYYVYNVTNLDLPEVVAQVNAAAVRLGTRVAATPDGKYLVTAAGYRTTPVYIFDIQPALDGRFPAVRTAIGAWTADWRNRPGSFEVRWPYVFVAALHDGFCVFNMRDPSEPYTVGFLRTWTGSLPPISDRSRDEEGAWAVDVRNRDGLIAVTDRQSGLWLIRVDGFSGWDGHGWGVPNVSSAQDWENGPDGVAAAR